MTKISGEAFEKLLKNIIAKIRDIEAIVVSDFNGVPAAFYIQNEKWESEVISAFYTNIYLSFFKTVGLIDPSDNVDILYIEMEEFNTVIQRIEDKNYIIILMMGKKTNLSYVKVILEKFINKVKDIF